MISTFNGQQSHLILKLNFKTQFFKILPFHSINCSKFSTFTMFLSVKILSTSSTSRRCRTRKISTTTTSASDSSCKVHSSSTKSDFILNPEKKKKNSGVKVPREKYIAVSKSDLLTAILLLFHSEEEIDHFVKFSSCLESIISAEHKFILEEMRIDYDLTHPKRNRDSDINDASELQVNSGENEIEPDTVASILDFRYLLSSSRDNVKSNSPEDSSRVGIASRFQRAFVQLLYNAEFEELSAADLMLTSALNNDYLLTLPINVDWKRASESKAIIYRRGFATERQQGLLIAEKLDYLQSKLLQSLFYLFSQPLMNVGMWLIETLKESIKGQGKEAWLTRIKIWVEEFPNLFLRPNDPYSAQMSDSKKRLGNDELSDNNLPIWIAAERAVSRYEGILSSAGPRGRLLRKLLIWTGVLPPIPEKSGDVDSDISTSEIYKRPIFLPRISLNDIWEPATSQFRAKDIFGSFKSAISILFSKSMLQEPAYEELILLYTEGMSDENKAEVPSLQLKIYEKIPIPDLPVIFPHKKLSFRILDTVRLDIASILGFAAYIINYKFEDIQSSPSALYLDVIAVSALVIYLSRIALGYKQTWDRYQLLVNTTLYEKTIASGFGSVHFLLDASGQQQYKEAILAYAVLLKSGNNQVTCVASIGDQCEKFIYDSFKAKVEIPVDKAIDTLLRLGLVKRTEEAADGKNRFFRAVPCLQAFEILKQRWNSLLK